MGRVGRKLSLVCAVAGAVVAVLASSAFAGSSSVRDSVYNDAYLAVGVQPNPLTVTVGNYASYRVPVFNNGPATATGVVLTDTLPLGTTFVAAEPSQGACAEASGVVTCSLGEVLAGQGAQVIIVVQTPTVPGTFTDKARVHAHQTNPYPSDARSWDSTVVVAASQDADYGFMLASGGVLSTGHGANAGNPQSTTVTFRKTPLGTAGWVTERSTTNTAAACGLGFVCFGQIVSIVGFADVTVAKPVVIRMRFDSSEIPSSASILHTRLFFHRSIVPHCFASANGAAAPDPCIASRTVLSDGDWLLVVRTTLDGVYRL